MDGRSVFSDRIFATDYHVWAGMNTTNQSSVTKGCLTRLGIAFSWMLISGLILWAMAALYFDLSFSRLPALTPILYLAIIGVTAYVASTRVLRIATYLAGFLVVLTCWLSLKPSNDRPWQPNDSQTPRNRWRPDHNS